MLLGASKLRHRWGWSSGIRIAGRQAWPAVRHVPRRSRHVTYSKKSFWPFGNTNRLAPSSPELPRCPGFQADKEEDIKLESDGDGTAWANYRLPRMDMVRCQWLRWRAKWDDLWGQLLYSYYNWRQDTWSDLQLFLLFNVILFAMGAWIEGTVIRRLDDNSSPRPLNDATPGWWGDFYAVMVWVLGQDLPQMDASLASQAFAVLTVILGLASFALVLALIEQVVLEVLESNVKRGSMVYEEGHIVVLEWCESSYDLAQLTRLLRQLCYGNKGKERSVVVVLTQNREKLEMESIFREAMPLNDRMGTQFVFRQGSPLDPGALRMVAVTKARAVIVCGDGARRSLDSDAQCMRSAVLVDEMVDSEGGRGPYIIVQVKSADPLPVLKYSCSPRVIGVPTFIAQARRISRMLKHPIVAMLSNMLTDYKSQAHVGVHAFPQLVGTPFKKLHFYFPYAVIVGLVNSYTGEAKLNPAPDRPMQLGDELILMRPGPAGECDATVPLLQPVEVELGDWDPRTYFLDSQDEEPLGVAQKSSASSTECIVPRSLSDYVSPSQVPQEVESDDEVADDEPVASKQEQARMRTWQRQHQHQKEESRQRELIPRPLYVLPVQFTSALVSASDLLICGWGGSSFMWTLLQDLDHGPQALPAGSVVTLVNNHNLSGVDDSEITAHHISNLKLVHIKVDPRSRTSLEQCLDISKYKAAIVLCDPQWSEAGSSSASSQQQHALSQSEMLRLDAAVLLVQMNIRYMLEEKQLPLINFVVEKMTYIGSTRYEDPSRLPLGLPVNQPSFCGKLLGMAAFDPRFLKPYSELGAQSDIVVQDSSAFARVGEEISYFQLQARAASVRQCVVGYYRIPTSADQPLDLVVNPQGVEARSEKMVLNQGDYRCKVVTLALNKALRRGPGIFSTGSSSGTKDLDDVHVPDIAVPAGAAANGATAAFRE